MRAYRTCARGNKSKNRIFKAEFLRIILLCSFFISTFKPGSRKRSPALKQSLFQRSRTMPRPVSVLSPKCYSVFPFAAFRFFIVGMITPPIMITEGHAIMKRTKNNDISVEDDRASLFVE